MLALDPHARSHARPRLARHYDSRTLIAGDAVIATSTRSLVRVWQGSPVYSHAGTLDNVRGLLSLPARLAPTLCRESPGSDVRGSGFEQAVPSRSSAIPRNPDTHERTRAHGPRSGRWLAQSCGSSMLSPARPVLEPFQLLGVLDTHRAGGLRKAHLFATQTFRSSLIFVTHPVRGSSALMLATRKCAQGSGGKSS
jgi:hypothetical protein